MKLGVMIFPTDTTIEPVELGREVEARGFESLWFPEHSHIPTDRTTPWGGRDGAPPLPEFYWRTYDQFLALAAIAATTTDLRLGTGITLVAQRDPLWLAKEVASLDRLSNGRFLFGIGYGWNKEELAHHGVAYTDRRARIRESILAMKELWTQDEASFDGEHISFTSSWSWPKPVQSPHPPIILGGAAGPRTARDIAEFCDGWMPIGGRHALDAGIGEIRSACEAIGRDPQTVELGVFGAPPDPAKIADLAEQGVTRAVLGLSQGSRDEVLADLDRFAPLLAEV
ncbi:MAG: LLM class F420-dependent oxidoreductase [Acidimicrobiales bacterium]